MMHMANPEVKITALNKVPQAQYIRINLTNLTMMSAISLSEIEIFNN